MGDRVLSQKKDRPAELEEMMERAKKKRQKRDGDHVGKEKKSNILMCAGGQSILDIGDVNGYQPTHAGSRASYESLLVSP